MTAQCGSHEAATHFKDRREVAVVTATDLPIRHQRDLNGRYMQAVGNDIFRELIMRLQ